MVNNKVKYRLGKTNYWGEARERRVRCGGEIEGGRKKGKGMGRQRGRAERKSARERELPKFGFKKEGEGEV